MLHLGSVAFRNCRHLNAGPAAWLRPKRSRICLHVPMRDTAADFSESDKLSRFDLIYMLPMALALGLTGLAAFLWSLTSSQCDEVDGAALRCWPMTISINYSLAASVQWLNSAQHFCCMSRSRVTPPNTHS